MPGARSPLPARAAVPYRSPGSTRQSPVPATRGKRVTNALLRSDAGRLPRTVQWFLSARGRPARGALDDGAITSFLSANGIVVRTAPDTRAAVRPESGENRRLRSLAVLRKSKPLANGGSPPRPKLGASHSSLGGLMLWVGGAVDPPAGRARSPQWNESQDHPDPVPGPEDCPFEPVVALIQSEPSGRVLRFAKGPRQHRKGVTGPGSSRKAGRTRTAPFSDRS